MPFEHYITSGGKRLRCGFTTGTCAALAAQGAVRLLLTGIAPERGSITTPKGLRVEVPLERCTLREGCGICAVRKDGGDDIDVTDGILIYARAELGDRGISIDGGEGVGRITKPGLDQPVGGAAINQVPRRMIREAIEEVCRQVDYTGGIKLTIYVPEGRAAAEKTFNPELGILGGISILGTSGIVEPMSTQAMIDTITLEIRQQAAMGERHLLLTPGNYGMDFLRDKGLDGLGMPVVKCSNFIGDALDQAAACGFASVLLVGHVGKLCKLAGGIMNTHSRQADCRTELFCAHGAICGGDTGLCRRLMEAATTDACLELLEEAGLEEAVMESMLRAIQRHLSRRTGPECLSGAILFSNVYGELGRTAAVPEILAMLSQGQGKETAL